MFSAMVLSAGLGQRLRPITDEIPKPLVPVGDRPLLATILENLREGGASRLALNVHYLPSEISKFVDSLGFEVHVEHERLIRGTAGGVRGARPHFAPGPVVVANGDIIVAADLAEFAHTSARWMRLLVCEPEDGPGPGVGTVGLGRDGRIVRLRGERFGRELASADFAGVSWLSETLLDALPPSGCLIGDVALPLLRRGEPVDTWHHPGEFTDIGSPTAYLRANLDWLAARDLSFWVAPGVRVPRGARLEAAVVGAGADLSEAEDLRQCVVLPGAVVRGSFEQAVLLPSGRVVSLG